MKKPKLFAELFFSMLKIGLFAFGGGYAMIALVENEFVSKKHWLQKRDFTDMIAIAESTPGPIAINCATFVGYTLAKTPGAIAATVAVCIPSFVIIFLISLFFDAFLALEYVYRAFQGIQVCVTFLILSAGLKMLKDIGRTPPSVLLFCASLFAMSAVSLFSVNFSSVYFILLGAAAGLTAYCISRLRKRKNAGAGKTNPQEPSAPEALPAEKEHKDREENP